MADAQTSPRHPWLWIPTVYFAEGMPNALVATVSVMLYSDLGVSNRATAFLTSWLYLPWVIKPLWSPAVDILKTRRLWIWTMQLVIGLGLAGVALMIPTLHFVQGTIVFFGLLAFSSATHDIAADGFYMLATTEREQSFFNGIRSTFYRVATILAQGELVSLVGKMHERGGDFASVWSAAFAIVAGIFFCFGIYHFCILPKPEIDAPKTIGPPENFSAEFFKTFGTFFRKPKILLLLSFLLLYRLGEAQLVKMVQPFLLDPRAAGGLGLTDDQLGLIYGKSGIAAL